MNAELSIKFKILAAIRDGEILVNALGGSFDIFGQKIDALYEYLVMTYLHHGFPPQFPKAHFFCSEDPQFMVLGRELMQVTDAIYMVSKEDGQRHILLFPADIRDGFLISWLAVLRTNLEWMNAQGSN